MIKCKTVCITCTMTGSYMYMHMDSPTCSLIPSEFSAPNESNHSATSHCNSSWVADCKGDTPSWYGVWSTKKMQVISFQRAGVFHDDNS